MLCTYGDVTQNELLTMEYNNTNLLAKYSCLLMTEEKIVAVDSAYSQAVAIKQGEIADLKIEDRGNLQTDFVFTTKAGDTLVVGFSFNDEESLATATNFFKWYANLAA